MDGATSPGDSYWVTTGEWANERPSGGGGSVYGEQGRRWGAAGWEDREAAPKWNEERKVSHGLER